MTNSKKEDIGDEGKMKSSVHENQTNDEVVEESSSLGVSSSEEEEEEEEAVNPNVGSSSSSSSSSSSVAAQGSRRRSGIHGGLAERLRCIFRDEEDGDLLLQQSDLETNVLQWLQALDLQVIGACRADERLKPLLKLKVSSGVAEDRLLAHLNQHFEVPEVGMLARCLCIPLVSIRVGKVFKQGAHLCPTATRGHLNLTLLPSSDLRISFVGDDGCLERLTTTLSRNSEDSAVVIEEILEDKSGRSFLLKFQCGKVSYFWCSEQSKPLGLELLAKMKDLLRGKPSLAQLTGISEPRLECFANQLRADLIGSTVSNTKANPTAPDTFEWDSSSRVSSSTSKSSRSRQINCSAMKPHSLCQSSLSPRAITFKDGAPRNFSTARSGSREKFRRRGDNHCSISGADTLLVASTSMKELSDTRQNEDIRIANVDVSLPISSLSFPETVRKSVLPPSSELPPLVLPLPQVTTPGSLFPPYYCWCPPCPSTLQYTVTSPHLPFSSIEAQSLPSLSSLLSAGRSSSSLVPPNPPLNLADLPSLDFPAFLPDPVAKKIPLPASSFITIPSSEQVPTFTPLTCDPIVHIPIIDFCSSGQGYLVSAGPAISTTSSPFHPKLMNPMTPETESLVEKGARETLRLLLGSSHTNPQLMEVFPSFLTSTDGVHSPIVVGSRGLYSSTRDVTTLANSIAALGLVSLPQRSIGCEVPKRCNSDNDGDNDMDKQPEPFEGLE